MEYICGILALISLAVVISLTISREPEDRRALRKWLFAFLLCSAGTLFFVLA